MFKVKIRLFVLISMLKLTKTLNVLVFTQNQGGLIKNLSKNTQIANNFDDFKAKLNEKIQQKNPDVIIYGIQELIELKPFELFGKDKVNVLRNFAGLAINDLSTVSECEFFKNILIQNFPLYEIKYNPNLSMVTYVLVKKENFTFKLKILKAVNQNGVFKKNNFNHGFWGQKGGIISFIEIFSVAESKYFKLISINSHLDSSDPAQRFIQYKTLLTETKNIVDGAGIKNFQIFFSGDMNSRLSSIEKEHLTENNSVSKYINLFKIDQNNKITNGNFYQPLEEFTNHLNNQEINLYKMEEHPVNFPPTYKLDFKKGINCWEEESFENCYKKKKNKIVYAYTDRIFYYTEPNQIISSEDYNILNSQLVSDHHTVYGFFIISTVNEEYEESKEIQIQNYSSDLEQVLIKNEAAVLLKNLLEFVKVDEEKKKLDEEEKKKLDEEKKANDTFLFLIYNVNFFFLNSEKIYNNMIKGESNSNCQPLTENSDKKKRLKELKTNFLNCFESIKFKKYEAILLLEDVENTIGIENNMDDGNVIFEEEEENYSFISHAFEKNNGYELIPKTKFEIHGISITEDGVISGDEELFDKYNEILTNRGLNSVILII